MLFFCMLFFWGSENVVFFADRSSFSPSPFPGTFRICYLGATGAACTYTHRRCCLQNYRLWWQLDLGFHLSRRTGALTRVLDRGSRSIQFVMQALVFNVVPTVLELGMVSVILTHQMGTAYAGVALGTIATYVTYTVAVTQWRTKFRLAMNKQENEAGAQAVESLIGYETVKYFGAEKYESERYDKSLALYQHANRKTTQSLSMLNVGQNMIFSAGMASMGSCSRPRSRGSTAIGTISSCSVAVDSISIACSRVTIVAYKRGLFQRGVTGYINHL